MLSCPSSTPTFSVSSGITTPDGGRSGRSDAANPMPWTRPKPKARGQRKRGSPDSTFSTATYTIDAAMAASTNRGGTWIQSTAAAIRVSEWATVNAVTILTT